MGPQLSRSNAGLMLGHRLRRWPSIKPALGERLVFAGLSGSDPDGFRPGR